MTPEEMSTEERVEAARKKMEALGVSKEVLDEGLVHMERDLERQAGRLIVIERGFQEGVPLTQMQKSSSLFSEEPTVLGKTLRRGSHRMQITVREYRIHEGKLLQLEKAGAIKITRPENLMTKPCELCGQTPRGQSGEFKCPKCALPTVMDLGAPEQVPAESTPPPAPVETAPAAPPEVIEPPPAPVETKPEDAPVPEKPKSSKPKK